MGNKPIRERLLLLIGLPGRVADPGGVYGSDLQENLGSGHSSHITLDPAGNRKIFTDPILEK